MGPSTNLAGYTIRSGDKLYLRQWQVSAQGGMGMNFSDGTYLSWQVQDQDGYWVNSDGTQNSWHNRTIDLSPLAGKTITDTYFIVDSYTPAGAWSVSYEDVVVSSSDGKVQPIYVSKSSDSYYLWSNNSTVTPTLSYLQEAGGPHFATPRQWVPHRFTPAFGGNLWEH